MEHSSILDGECMITGAQPDPLKHYIFSVLHLLTSHIFFVVYYAARSPVGRRWKIILALHFNNAARTNSFELVSRIIPDCIAIQFGYTT